jgi:hypothetical protein
MRVPRNRRPLRMTAIHIAAMAILARSGPCSAVVDPPGRAMDEGEAVMRTNRLTVMEAPV